MNNKMFTRKYANIFRNQSLVKRTPLSEKCFTENDIILEDFKLPGFLFCTHVAFTTPNNIFEIVTKRYGY